MYNEWIINITYSPGLTNHKYLAKERAVQTISDESQQDVGNLNLLLR